MKGEKVLKSDDIWKRIIMQTSNGGDELQTKTGLWFRATSGENTVYVSSAKNHTPSSKISAIRPISKYEFLRVYDYYDRWISGEHGVRQEARNISKNTAYIFALIKKYA